MKAVSTGRADGEAAVLALKAGVNILLLGSGDPGIARAAIRKAVESGRLPRGRIEESYRLVSALKKKYAKPGRRDSGLEVSGTYRDVSRSIARAGVTLVRNEEATVPFAPQVAAPKVCAVFFTPPRFSGDMLSFSSPLMGKGWKVVSYNSRAEPSNIDEARALDCAENADLTVVGSFQWAAKPVESQTRLVKKLIASSKRTALLSLMSPYDIPLYPEAKTVIALYGATKFSAEAAAKLITGAIPPKGKLPVKLPVN
jgi:beta-N-acetylhexosaminidase